jgi:ketosteroid isomerase-like protein
LRPRPRRRRPWLRSRSDGGAVALCGALLADPGEDLPADAALANFREFDSELTAIYPAADTDAVCVEYRNRAVLTDGTEYTNDNIAVFRFEDGLISAYHDDFDPRRFQTVVDALAAG